MKELYFDPNWSYKELSLHLRTLRIQYQEILASFYYFDIKEVIAFKKKVRDTIYSYQFRKNPRDNEKLHDIAWEYMNYFAEFDGFDFKSTVEER